MFADDTKNKIENIIQGSIIEGNSDYCTSIRNYLCSSYSTSKTPKRDFEINERIKKEQSDKLASYATENNSWIKELPNSFIAAGGESKVYLTDDGTSVLKTNHAYYYSTWLEYFNSILLHNLLFTDTKYSLEGFIMINETLHLVLKQPYITSESLAELDDIREFLGYNGFKKYYRQDYYNADFGLILEDMHDENVIVNSDKLFFIDTVFYIDEKGESIKRFIYPQ